MTPRRIQVRRGSAAEWTAANPILLAGEVGYERDTAALKIGDGVTRWSSLPYLTGFSGGSSTLATLQDVLVSSPQDGNVLRYENGKWHNYSEDQLLNGGNF